MKPSMKVDKRLSAEFGMQLPPVSRLPWTVENIAEWIIGHTIPFMVSTGLLGIGALIARYYPPAFWWFMAASGVALLCVAAMFGLVLAANAMEMPEHDDDYPTS